MNIEEAKIILKSIFVLYKENDSMAFKVQIIAFKKIFEYIEKIEKENTNYKMDKLLFSLNMKPKVKQLEDDK